MKILVSFLMIGLLAGCLKTRSELKDNSSGNMRTDASGSYVTGAVGQQQRAQIDSRFFEIDRDFRELYGKIETLERKVEENKTPMAAQTQNPATTNAASNAKIISLEKRISTLEEALLALDKKINGMGGNKSDKSAQTKTYNSEPKGPFSQGEAFFEQGEYEKAISSYDTYRKRFPRGRRYAQATLKMGLAFEKLQMKNDAKAFYKEVIQRYPKTKVALTAQANLKKL